MYTEYKNYLKLSLNKEYQINDSFLYQISAF